MMAESVVIFNQDFARDFPTLRKQNLLLASKMRFLAAQYVAYFTDDLWLENARHANAMARLLAELVADMPHVSAEPASGGHQRCFRESVPGTQREIAGALSFPRGRSRGAYRALDAQLQHHGRAGTRLRQGGGGGRVRGKPCGGACPRFGCRASVRWPAGDKGRRRLPPLALLQAGRRRLETEGSRSEAQRLSPAFSRVKMNSPQKAQTSSRVMRTAPSVSSASAVSRAEMFCSGSKS